MGRILGPRFDDSLSLSLPLERVSYIFASKHVGHPLSSTHHVPLVYFFFEKGKLPPMIGHDQPSTNGNRAGDNKVQLSAGDLLGRTHEELVLLLIQLRRQSSALVKARDACLLEMESQVLTDLFISILGIRIYTNGQRGERKR